MRDTAAIPAGYDVWVIPTINPDGNIVNIHQNRTASTSTGTSGPTGSPTTARRLPATAPGPAPLSEPESKAHRRLRRRDQAEGDRLVPRPSNVVDAATLNGVANPAVLTAYAARVRVRRGHGDLQPDRLLRRERDAVPELADPWLVVVRGRAVLQRRRRMTPTGVNNHINGFFAAAAAADGPP